MRCWELVAVVGVVGDGRKYKNTRANMKRMLAVVVMNYVAPIPSTKPPNKSILYPRICVNRPLSLQHRGLQDPIRSLRFTHFTLPP